MVFRSLAVFCLLRKLGLAVFMVFSFLLEKKQILEDNSKFNSSIVSHFRPGVLVKDFEWICGGQVVTSLVVWYVINTE